MNDRLTRIEARVKALGWTITHTAAMNTTEYFKSGDIMAISICDPTHTSEGHVDIIATFPIYHLHAAERLLACYEDGPTAENEYPTLETGTVNDTKLDGLDFIIEPPVHYPDIDRVTFPTIPDWEIEKWRKERLARVWYRRLWRGVVAWWRR